MRNSLIFTALITMFVLTVPGWSQGFRVLDEAPLDRAVDFPREELVSMFREVDAQAMSGIRLLEGGEYNVNIRHDENVTPEDFVMRAHPDTIDVWIVQEGSGTLVTGGENVGDQHVGGVERFISVGDVVFIPAGLLHGIKETSSITWFNIRFPEHRN